MPSAQLPSGPAAIWQAIQEIRRDLRELRASRRAERTGALRVYTSAGVLILETGSMPYAHTTGTDQQGIRVYREDGSLVASVQAQPTVTGVDRQSLTLYDWGSNAIVGDDPISGVGLARPYIPISFADSNYLEWPATFSVPWVDLKQTTIKKQQAMAYVAIGYTMDTSGATGEVRISVNGSPVSTYSVTFFVTTATVGPFPLPGDYLDDVDIRLQARFTGGSGSLRGQVLAASQIQS
ncbi:hypothetical protein J7E94_05070 [Streptomyces sp. ISL-94]|nr:hypothetical protein [Streptomyces sp. ISL-94]